MIQGKIAHLTFKGEGRVYWNGQWWTIPKVLVHEQIKAMPLEHRHLGLLTHIVQSSSLRRKVDCPEWEHCPGCALRHMDPQSALDHKVQVRKQGMTRMGLHGFEQHKVLGPLKDQGYRTRAQCHWAGEYWGMKGWKKSIDLSQCPAHHPRLNLWIKVWNAMAVALPNPSECLFNAEVIGDDAGILTLWCRNHASKVIRNLLEQWQSHWPQVTVGYGLWTKRDGRKKAWTHVAGPSYQYLKIGERKLRRSPLSWSSAMPEYALYVREQLLKDWAHPRPKEDWLEIGCGIGTHSLDLATQCQSLWALDLNRQAIEDAQYNAHQYGFSNLHFWVGKAEKILVRWISLKKKFHGAVIHGMRQGMGLHLGKYLALLGVREILHISPTLYHLVQVGKVLEAHGYKGDQITWIDTMPSTYHLMSVSRWKKL